MGIVKSIFGGSDSKQKSSSQPKDMTPNEFVGMRPEVANQLGNLFASGGGQAFTGQTAAPVTGNENQLLSQIMQMTGQPSGAAQAGQNFLQQVIQGQNVPGGNVLGGVDMVNPQALGVDVQGIQGGVQTGQANPFLNDAIMAAQRPLIEQYQDQIAPALRAQFTLAGQQIGGQGSSPFHMAAAREQAGMANALGDIGSEMAYQDFAQRQQLGSQEFQQLRDLMVSQELQGRGQDIQAGGLNQGAQMGMRDQQLQQSQQELAGRGQRLDAVTQSAGIERSQLENVLAGLEAQALPRMIEQLGIERGMEEFRRREEQLLQAIQMAGQLSSPTIANVSRGSGSSSSSTGMGGAIGGAIGGFFS